MRVERLTHAVQSLEFEFDDAKFRSALHHPRDRVRIVRCEHRIKERAAFKHCARAGQIRDVGVRLAREYRIAGKTQHLRAFDLGIPVRPFHETHGDPAVRLTRQRGDPIEQRPSALLISLHGETEPVVVDERQRALAGIDCILRDVSG